MATATPSRNRTLTGAHIAMALLGLLYLGITLSSAMRKAAVVDEVPHIGAGIAYWKTGDFRMNPEHPPLVKALAGGLALLTVPIKFQVERQDGATLSFWLDGEQNQFGNFLMYQMNDADRILFWSRLVPILFGWMGIVAVWWWGRELGGPTAGWMAAAFLAFYPEYVGHARWVTFDVPVAASCAICSLALWRWWKRPTAARASVFIVAAVLGSLVKLTVGLFLGALGICVFGSEAIRRIVLWKMKRRGVKPGSDDREGHRETTGAEGKALAAHRPWNQRRGLIPLCAVFGLTLAVLYLAIWSIYGFRFSLTASDQVPLDRQNMFLMYSSQKEGKEEGWRDIGVMRWTRPIWERHLIPEAFLTVLNHASSFKGRMSFLRGDTSRNGFATYFFWTILYKTPLLYLGLGVVALVYGLHRVVGSFGRDRTLRAMRNRMALTFWVLPFVVLGILTVMSRINLGHRYILFLYIPWCIAMGGLCSHLFTTGKRWMRGTILAILAISFLIQIRTYPDYCSYFNLLGGSPMRASQRLLDSNIDWGQDLKAAGRYVTENRLGRVNLAYFGAADPGYYGIREFHQILPSYPYAINLPPYSPMDPSRTSLISFNNLPSVRLLYPGVFDGPPDAMLNSILVYSPRQSDRNRETDEP